MSRGIGASPKGIEFFSTSYRHQHPDRLVFEEGRAATEHGGASGFAQVDDQDATWSGVPLQFPRIQGADACGRIVAVGAGVDPDRVGERVLITGASGRVGSDAVQLAKAPRGRDHRDLRGVEGR